MRGLAEIRVSDLHFHYIPGVEVLRGIDLTLSPGATAIIGQNGAGKSTFVRLLNGLLKPTRGEVLVDGVSTRSTTVAALARKVGLVFQNPTDQLFKSRVLDEVMFGPLNLGLGPEEARRRAEAALERVGLIGAAQQNPYDLGLAERKLVTIASVLAMETPVVILDEPTIAQDVTGVRQIGAIVAWLREQGRTVIAITHDMDFVARYFERVLVFHEGRVLADGTAQEIFRQPDLLRQAGLEPPPITELGRALGLPDPPLTVEAFVARVRALQAQRSEP
ncbi:MAG: ABC transporter ATP-binding protein [Bacillota bacterium]